MLLSAHGHTIADGKYSDATGDDHDGSWPRMTTVSLNIFPICSVSGETRLLYLHSSGNGFLCNNCISLFCSFPVDRDGASAQETGDGESLV